MAALLTALEAHAIGPFVNQSLDEPFGFAIGSGPVGPLALGVQAQDLTSLLPGFGALGAPVIR